MSKCNKLYLVYFIHFKISLLTLILQLNNHNIFLYLKFFWCLGCGGGGIKTCLKSMHVTIRRNQLHCNPCMPKESKWPSNKSSYQKIDQRRIILFAKLYSGKEIEHLTSGLILLFYRKELFLPFGANDQDLEEYLELLFSLSILDWILSTDR